MKLLDLPDEILENVLSYLSYDEIAKNRVVCRKFNLSCGQLLNRGFLLMERKHSTIFKKVKSLLPRRESERRVHHLARHSNILTAIDTRINMLRLTFMKYVEKNVCCFIPGKVIDEILRILALVENTCTPRTPPRTHEVLQELRDISSMAMEHFDEKIAPNLKLQRTVPFSVLPGPSLLNNTLPSFVLTDTFRKDFSIVQRRTLSHKQHISLIRDVVSKLISKVRRQNTIMYTQVIKLRQQASKLKEHEKTISDLKRHVEEWDAKFADLVTKLSKTEEVSTSKSPSPSTLTSNPQNHNAPPRLYKSNIKPRMAQILPKSFTKIDLPSFDYERKRKLPSTSAVVPKMARMQYLDDDSDLLSTSNQFDSYTKLPTFLSSTLESILKSPISSIKSRKRKLQ